MVQSIEHTAIASPDPQALAKWYVETLGFTINYDSGRTVFVRTPSGSMLEIITSEGERAPQTMKTPGIRHLALAVNDFASAHQALLAKGVKFDSEPQVSKGTTVVFFADPDGNILHLIQRAQPLPERL